MHKLVNGVRIKLTTEEIAERQARIDNYNAGAFDRAMENLRAKRNGLLKETDHYALSDQTLSDDMRTYRQDLRDITDGLTTKAEVDAVTWPTKP